MKILFALCFSFLSIATFAQKTEDVMGSWKFEDVYGKEDMEAEAVEMLNKFFADMVLNFGEESAYSATMMGSEDTGTWTLKDEGIVINSNKGENKILGILDYSADHLSLDFGKGKFILAKVEK